MKVHEVRAAAAANQPPRRDRRIDAAREQAQHAAARADRQPARARLPCRSRRTRRRSAPRRESSTSGCERLTGQPVAVLHAPADDALDLRRRNRKPLVGASRGDPETSSRYALRRRRPRAAAIASRSGATRAGAREKLPMPGSRASRARTSSQSRAGPEPHHDPAEHEPHVGRRRGRPSSASNRPHEHADEPRPVAALERQFAVVNDDGGHRR